MRADAAQVQKDRGCLPERKLWAEVVKTALEDVAGRVTHASGRRLRPSERAKVYADAMRYLRSELFEIHCAFLDLDPDRTRAGILRRSAR